MRSAFEIADTNGDGVLTYSEAIEVSNGFPLKLPFTLFLSYTHIFFNDLSNDKFDGI
jgi:hypothetical protein